MPEEGWDLSARRGEWKMRKILENINKLPKALIVAIGVVLVVCLAELDYLTGGQLSFSLFYVVPVALVAWYTWLSAAVVVSVLSASAWWLVDYITGHAFSYAIMPIGNAFGLLGFFLIISFILSGFKESLERRKEEATVDFLTEIPNRRFFYDEALKEISRARRFKTPLTIAYMDIDDFKDINDSFGHDTGDVILRIIAQAIKGIIRTTDLVARLGGDEFVVLMGGVGEDNAKTAIGKVHTRLTELAETNNYHVTFSIGVVSYDAPPRGVAEMVTAADKCMYAVKISGKNAIQYLGVKQPANNPIETESL